MLTHWYGRSSRRSRSQKAPRAGRKARHLCPEVLEERTLLSFLPANTYAVGSGPAGIAVADFNGDGRADLARVDTTAGSVRILLNNGANTFQPGPSSPANASPTAAVTGDFNADGR